MPKKSWKGVLFMMIAGSIVFLTGISLSLPRIFSWVFEPPASVGISCSGAVRWAVERVLLFQLSALIIGAVTGFFAGLWFKNRQKNS